MSEEIQREQRMKVHLRPPLNRPEPAAVLSVGEVSPGPSA